MLQNPQAISKYPCQFSFQVPRAGGPKRQFYTDTLRARSTICSKGLLSSCLFYRLFKVQVIVHSTPYWTWVSFLSSLCVQMHLWRKQTIQDVQLVTIAAVIIRLSVTCRYWMLMSKVSEQGDWLEAGHWRTKNLFLIFVCRVICSFRYQTSCWSRKHPRSCRQPIISQLYSTV